MQYCRQRSYTCEKCFNTARQVTHCYFKNTSPSKKHLNRRTILHVWKCFNADVARQSQVTCKVTSLKYSAVDVFAYSFRRSCTLLRQNRLTVSGYYHSNDSEVAKTRRISPCGTSQMTQSPQVILDLAWFMLWPCDMWLPRDQSKNLYQPHSIPTQLSGQRHRKFSYLFPPRFAGLARSIKN